MVDIRTKLDPQGNSPPLKISTDLPIRVIVEQALFEVELLDEHDSPMPGILCRVEFDNGKIIEKRSDDKGRFFVRHDAAQSVARFTLPGRDGSTWEPETEASNG